MLIFKRAERFVVRTMCRVQHNDGKIAMDLMVMFGLNETIDLLAMANSVRWYGHMLWREDGHV